MVSDMGETAVDAAECAYEQAQGEVDAASQLADQIERELIDAKAALDQAQAACEQDPNPETFKAAADASDRCEALYGQLQAAARKARDLTERANEACEALAEARHAADS